MRRLTIPRIDALDLRPIGRRLRAMGLDGSPDPTAWPWAEDEWDFPRFPQARIDAILNPRARRITVTTHAVSQEFVNALRALGRQAACQRGVA